MIDKILKFTSYKLIPYITLDKKAPDVAIFNSSYLNWKYLKKSMQMASKKYISGICLDIGSGNSPYKKYLNVDEYISVDNKETQATSYQKNQNEVNADAKDLPFSDKYADSVLLNQVLEHVDDYDAVLSEIHRVLKDDGKFILSVPFIYHIHGEPNDYFRFSEYGIQHILQKHNFKILEFEYQGYVGTTLVSILNSFIWQVWNKNKYTKLLRNIIFLIPILFIFMLNNILGMILDLFKNKKFCPNYFIVCEKIYE